MRAEGSSTTSLGALVELVTDQVNPGAHPSTEFEHFSIPAYDEGMRPQTELGSAIKSNKFRVPDGALLLSKLNPRINRVWDARPTDGVQAIASTEFLVLAVKEGTDRRYLRYLLSSPDFRDALTSRVTGTSGSHQRVRPADVLDIEVAVPDRSAQAAIGATLGALDDKIGLNRRMSETLEEMARALFKAWLLESLEDPDSVPFADVVLEHKEKWVPTDASPVLHFSLPAFDAGRQPVREPGTAIKSAKTVVPKGAVLVSRLNPRIPRVWLTDVPGDLPAVASTEFLVATPKAPYGRCFLFLTSTSDDFQGSLVSMATGTSGSHQRVRPGAVLSVMVPSAPESELRRLEEVAGPLLDRVLAAQRESTTLAALRDALLPKLISGELRVPEAERLVSEVV